MERKRRPEYASLSPPQSRYGFPWLNVRGKGAQEWQRGAGGPKRREEVRGDPSHSLPWLHASSGRITRGGGAPSDAEGTEGWDQDVAEVDRRIVPWLSTTIS